MDIYKPGTSVSINGDIEGNIIQVIITPTLNCLYKCVWWNGNTRMEEFLYECEIKPNDNTKKQKIGYK